MSVVNSLVIEALRKMVEKEDLFAHVEEEGPQTVN